MFWESTAQMASFSNLMINEIFQELGPAVEKRMSEVSGLYGRFIGHVGESGRSQRGRQVNAPAKRAGLPFARMHGCGSDFVVIDDRAGLWHARREDLAREVA